MDRSNIYHSAMEQNLCPHESNKSRACGSARGHHLLLRIGNNNPGHARGVIKITVTYGLSNNGEFPLMGGRTMLRIHNNRR
jgi:hypothetical protein